MEATIRLFQCLLLCEFSRKLSRQTKLKKLHYIQHKLGSLIHVKIGFQLSYPHGAVQPSPRIKTNIAIFTMEIIKAHVLYMEECRRDFSV